MCADRERVGVNLSAAIMGGRERFFGQTLRRFPRGACSAQFRDYALVSMSSGAGIWVASQFGVSLECSEVHVGMEEFSAGSNRHSSNEAVDQFADCLSSSTADSIEGRRLVEVSWGCWEHRRPVEQSPQLGEVVIVSGASQDLHRNRIANR